VRSFEVELVDESVEAILLLQAVCAWQDAGYSSVSSLKKDDNGVWRGKAVKGGVSTNVSLDPQGRVGAE
jgi:hypothetical protein